MNEITICPIASEIVSKIFAIFYSLCRGFEKQYDNPVKLNLEKIQWVMAFMEQRITQWSQIQSCISQCWIEPNLINTPSLGTFLSWRKDKIGDEIPTFEIAYNECCLKSHPTANRKNWSHIVVYHSWQEMKAANFTLKNEKESRKMYEHYYHYTVKQFKEGKTLRSMPLAIEGTCQDNQSSRIRSTNDSKVYQEYLGLSKAEKMQAGYAEHPTWTECEISRGHRDFSDKTFDEYKKYLLCVDETMALTLSKTYAYDRMRFLTQSEAQGRVDHNKQQSTYQDDAKTSPSGSEGVKKAYKNWVKD